MKTLLATVLIGLVFTSVGCRKGENAAKQSRTQSADGGTTTNGNFLTNGVSLETLLSHFGEPITDVDLGGGTTFVTFATTPLNNNGTSSPGISVLTVQGRAVKIAEASGDMPEGIGRVDKNVRSLRFARVTLKATSADKNDSITLSPAGIFPIDTYTNRGRALVRSAEINIFEEESQKLKAFSESHLGETVSILIESKTAGELFIPEVISKSRFLVRFPEPGLTHEDLIKAK